MFLLNVPVNIQQWYQLLFHLLHPSDITHHVLSGEPSEHPIVVSSLVPGTFPTVLFRKPQITTYTNTKTYHYIIFF